MSVSSRHRSLPTTPRRLSSWPGRRSTSLAKTPSSRPAACSVRDYASSQYGIAPFCGSSRWIMCSLLIPVANTDTRSMWNLTTNIFRFTPAVVSQNLNQHTVDEVGPTPSRAYTTFADCISASHLTATSTRPDSSTSSSATRKVGRQSDGAGACACCDTIAGTATPQAWTLWVV
jgi:hypothetical protein